MQTLFTSPPPAPRPLSPAEASRIGGGLNPQPLPPREASRFLYAGGLRSVYVDGLYWGDYYIG